MFPGWMKRQAKRTCLGSWKWNPNWSCCTETLVPKPNICVILSLQSSRRLFHRICDQNKRGIRISEAVLCLHAEQLCDKTNLKLSDDARILLTFSKCWFDRFQKRYNVKYIRVHDEALSANGDVIPSAMPLLNKNKNSTIRITFGTWISSDCLFNSPRAGQYVQSLWGDTKKTRITLLACGNFTKTEKFSLTVISKSERPGPFWEKYGHELGTDYYCNSKAWMTQNVFLNGWNVLTCMSVQK